MPAIKPEEKPRLSAAALRAMLQPLGIDRRAHPLVVVGIRGYYRDSMGAPGVDDIDGQPVHGFTLLIGGKRPSSMRLLY